QDRAPFAQESGSQIKVVIPSGNDGDVPTGVQCRSGERDPVSGPPEAESPAVAAETFGEEHPSLPLTQPLKRQDTSQPPQHGSVRRVNGVADHEIPIRKNHQSRWWGRVAERPEEGIGAAV